MFVLTRAWDEVVCGVKKIFKNINRTCFPIG